MDIRGIDQNAELPYCIVLCSWTHAGKNLDNIVCFVTCTLKELDQLGKSIWEDNNPGMPRKISFYLQGQGRPFRKGDNFRNFMRETPIPTFRTPTIFRTWNEPDLS